MSESYMPFGGVLHDVSSCSTPAEIIDIEPRLGVEVDYEPVYTENPQTGEVQSLGDYKVPVNSATREPLGTGVVVGVGQTPFQNSTRFEILQNFVDLGCTYKSAGVAKGGLRTLVEIELPDGHFSIARSNGEEDEYRARISNIGGNDGGQAEVWAELLHRLWCMNQIPGLVEDGKLMQFRHTLNINTKRGTIERMIAQAITGAGQQKHTLESFASRNLSPSEFDAFVVKLITGEDDMTKAGTIWNADMDKGGKAASRKNFYYDTLSTLYRQGQGNGGRDALDAFNAVTEYCDWCHGQAQGDADAHIARIVHGEIIPQRDDTPNRTPRVRPSLRLVVGGESEGDDTVEQVPVVESIPVVPTNDERSRVERRLQSNLNGQALRMKQRAYGLLTEMVAEAA